MDRPEKPIARIESVEDTPDGIEVTYRPIPQATPDRPEFFEENMAELATKACADIMALMSLLDEYDGWPSSASRDTLGLAVGDLARLRDYLYGSRRR